MSLDLLNLPLEALINHFLNANKRLFWLYLVSAAVIAFVIFIKQRNQGNFFCFIFDKSVWLHKSAKQDYIIWLINIVIKLSVIIPLLFAAAPIAIFISQQLTALFGEQPPISNSRSIVMFCFTLLVFLLDDFTRFYLHYLMHRVPWLWQLHKVHHSAEVLTPFTVYRIHPIESALYAMRLVFVQGVAIGIGFYIFGHQLNILEVLGANLILFVFNIMGSNLRHSHIWFGWGNIIENWFISPAQHQIHHSIHQRHFDKNFGSVLAIWDRVFKTLLLSKETERPEGFGLSDCKNEGLLKMYFKPLIPFPRLLKSRLRRG